MSKKTQRIVVCLLAAALALSLVIPAISVLLGG